MLDVILALVGSIALGFVVAIHGVALTRLAGRSTRGRRLLLWIVGLPIAFEFAIAAVIGDEFAIWILNVAAVPSQSWLRGFGPLLGGNIFAGLVYLVLLNTALGWSWISWWPVAVAIVITPIEYLHRDIFLYSESTFLSLTPFLVWLGVVLAGTHLFAMRLRGQHPGTTGQL